MSEYSDKHDQLVAIAEAREQAVSDAQEIDNFIRRHQEIIDCQANRRVLYDYFHGGDISEIELEDSWLNHLAFRKSLACYKSEVDVRSALTREIYSLLAGSMEAKNHVVAQLKYKTVEEIVAQRDELKRRVQLQQKSPNELRQLVNRPPDAPQLGPEHTRDTLIALSKSDIKAFKALTVKFGSDAVNRRLNGKISPEFV